jgi:metal-responsive CopG/Arc/MetJ family transcriptional regulator
MMKREYDFSKARRGPVIPTTPGKTRITIRLDNDIIQHFQGAVDRAGGGNYQTLINDALREYIRGARLEMAVRKAVREGVKTASESFASNGVKSRATRLREGL